MIKATSLLIFISSFCLIALKSTAQDTQKETLPKEKLIKTADFYKQWISFAHINDLFRIVGLSDRYYSFGHQFDYLKKIKAHSTKKPTRTNYYNIGLNFEGYTPEIGLDFPDSAVIRPFAGWSYLTLGFINNKPSRYIN